jgi:predicted DNA-binding protein
MKTLAIRLEDQQHAQLSVLAQVEGTNVTDFIRSAIDARIEHMVSQPEITARAEQILAEIDAEAATRRSAIAGLFAPSEEPTDEAAKPTTGRRRKPGSDS